MSASAAEVHFAAEFVTFLAAAVGIAVVVLRGDLLTAQRTRVPMGAGFVLLGAAAFLHGSLLLGDSDTTFLTALRVLGVAGLAVGATQWAGPKQGIRLLWPGLAVIAFATVLALTDALVAASLILAAGSLAVGAAVVLASRRSVASRVAASASLTLLLVVLVLAVGISAVLSSTVQDQARDRLATRAASEAGFTRDPANTRILEAGLVAGALTSSGVVGPLATAASDSDSAQFVTSRLESISDTFLEERPLAYIAADGGGVAVGSTQGFPGTGDALAGSAPVKAALQRSTKVGSVIQLGNQLLAMGIAPVVVMGNDKVRKTYGVAVAVSPLDSGYVETRIIGETDFGAGIATRENYVASAGQRPGFDSLRSLVESVLENPDATRTAEIGDRYVGAAAVRSSDNRPVAVALVWQPTTVVADTREELYQVLFLIALGGTLLALALASLVGNRIGSGLRVLTDAAGAIQRGDLTARADIQADDEVGVLGATFDSMATSIQDKTNELGTARNRLEAVVAGMGEALIATDADGRVTDFNRSAEELLAVTAADVKGMPVDEVLTLRADDGTSVTDRLRKPSPRRWAIEGSLVTNEEEHVPVSLSAGALRGLDDELTGAVYVLRDLRREREVERMKTEFLSRIGHELRTPLTGITGYAELLIRKDVKPELARQWYEEILKQSRALLRIVQMLEFFASTGAGRVMLRPELVNLRHLIDDVVKRREGKLPDHKLVRRVGRGVPKIVADERWLVQMIDELVDNAVKFSPEGCRVTVSAAMAEDGRVEIAVADKGVGMTREEQDLAFTEFVQGDTSDTRRFGGLGLGLSLVQRVAEAHGGTVECASAPGKGSKFSIFLPLVPIEE